MKGLLKSRGAFVLFLMVSFATVSQGAQIDVVRVSGLDKVTGRHTVFDIPIGETKDFGTLAIKALECKKSSALEAQDSKALLEIINTQGVAEESKGATEDPKDTVEKPSVIFRGWMLASSPALSMMIDPIYSVTVLSCQTVASATEFKNLESLIVPNKTFPLPPTSPNQEP